MTDQSDSLVLEHLRAIRSTQAEHGERLAQIELHLSTMGQQLGALTTAVYAEKGDQEVFSVRAAGVGFSSIAK
jgi:hypothetical protein